MKFIIDRGEFGELNEVGQVNPIRWTILKETGPGKFKAQGQQMKCTDYFNDVVAYKVKKTEFSVYGFKNNVKFEEDGGLFVLVEHLKPNFEHNVAIINEQLMKDFGCQIGVCKDEDEVVVLHFPKEVLETTYRVSLLLWVLRLGNYSLAFKSWKDIFENTASAANGPEGGIKNPKVKKHVPNLGFKVPDNYTKYWWFYGDSYNSEQQPNQSGTLIHNTGCSAWWANMVA